MSALQKLAVAREVGTSRAAAAPSSHNSKDANSEPGCQEVQQMMPVLHPLLQSLNFPQPASGKAKEFALKRASSSIQPTVSQHNKLACRNAGSTPAATALAHALKHNHQTPLGSSSAHHLLQSIAATQKEQQLKQLRTLSRDTAAEAHTGNAAIISINAPGADAQLLCCKRPRNGSSSSSTSLHQALAAAAAAAAAVTAAPKVTVKRPVTPLITKPHKPGSIRMQPPHSRHQGNTAAAAAAAAGTALTKSSCSCFSSCKPAATGSRGCALTPSAALTDTHQHGCVQSSAVAAAAAVRPGTAAAFKILRLLSHQSCISVSRPRTAGGCPSSDPASPLPCTELGQHNLQIQEHEKPLFLEQVGSSQLQSCQAPLLQPLQEQPQQEMECMTGNDKECCAQQQQQQQQAGEEAHYFSRPSTAALRALLASSHSKDGIAERLDHYRKLTSTHDNSAGLDIVHEADEDDAALPDWLKPTRTGACASQATPMVLNLEDLVQSTPEVLEAEIEQQLQELDLKQLQALTDTMREESVQLR